MFNIYSTNKILSNKLGRRKAYTAEINTNTNKEFLTLGIQRSNAKNPIISGVIYKFNADRIKIPRALL